MRQVTSADHLCRRLLANHRPLITILPLSQLKKKKLLIATGAPIRMLRFWMLILRQQTPDGIHRYMHRVPTPA